MATTGVCVFYALASAGAFFNLVELKGVEHKEEVNVSRIHLMIKSYERGLVMKKLVLILTLVSMLVLSACGHSHTWTDADCTRPKTCADCGEIEGEALGHSWDIATCTKAKTCNNCNAMEGDALGHHVPNLTCIDDAVCMRCDENIKAPGHLFLEATCTEPAKCSVCGELSGEALGHTSASGICGRCGLETYETVNGRGDDVISNIIVGSDIYRVHFTHSGRSNFIVRSYDAENDRELLINEIGYYDGYVLLMGKAPFTFEITANGSWTYTIEPLDKIADTSFAGKGDYVTGLSSFSSGVWRFTHDGKSNFVVRVYTSDGRDLLVNEIGKYDGKKMLTIPSGSYSFFEINADGNWTIEKS